MESEAPTMIAQTNWTRAYTHLTACTRREASGAHSLIGIVVVNTLGGNVLLH